MGLTINGDFTASRVLDIKLDHVQKAAMTYLGLYGPDRASLLLNQTPGTVASAVSLYEEAGIQYGKNYFTMNAATSAGVQAADQPKLLPATIFTVFNADAHTGTADVVRQVSALWGTNPSTAANPGLLAISLLKASDANYVILQWGTGTDIPFKTCAVKFDWTTATGPIMAIGSRDDTGKMRLEVRAAGVAYKAAAAVTPVAIPSSTASWRFFTGQISARPLNGLKIFANACWSVTMTAEEMSAELDVMQMNLAARLV
ncbi:hypothetical protein [Erwinia sp. 9145]|uniref:hypothetical protein n=1 Tax=Erwinia sp. 9145 TaxID=1500895 RepID=UPI000558351C|nr:hypothetical protein [Erwinia sp. 9145]